MRTYHPHETDPSGCSPEPHRASGGAGLGGAGTSPGASPSAPPGLDGDSGKGAARAEAAAPRPIPEDVCERPGCPGSSHEGERRPGRFDPQTNRCRSCGAGPHWRARSTKDGISNWRWREPGTFPDKPKQKRKSSGGRRKRRGGRKPRLSAEQKIDRRVQPRWADPREDELLEEGLAIIEAGATGAPPHRPRSGVTRDDLLAGLVWRAAAESDLDLRRIGIVTAFPELTETKQGRISLALVIAGIFRERPDTNAAALAKWLGLHRSQVYKLRRDGVRLIELGNTLARIEQKIDRALEEIVAGRRENEAARHEIVMAILAAKDGESIGAAAERYLHEAYESH
jgi:hypothetical protein